MVGGEYNDKSYMIRQSKYHKMNGNSGVWVCPINWSMFTQIKLVSYCEW